MESLINDICREFRKLRGKLIRLTEDEFNRFLRQVIDNIWKEQPWYLKLMRKQIMKLLYRIIKDFSKLIDKKFPDF